LHAQTGKRLANYWVHNGFVIFNHTKMSKSLNNFCTLSDVSKSDIENRAIRFALLSSQYRNPVNFSPETVKQGVKTIKAIDLLVSKLKKIIKNPPIKQVPEPEPDFVEYPKEAIEYVDNSGPSQETLKLFTNVTATANKYITSFEEAICDDIDTPAALKSLFGFVNFMQKALCVRSDDFTPDEATIAINCLQQMDKVFGVFFPSEASGSQKIKEFQIAPNSECNDMRLIEASDAPPEVAELLRRRAKAKESRDFAASDQIRAQLKQLGYAVVDNRDGSVDLFEIIS
jgi:cysteinyl-tRNA synthetase